MKEITASTAFMASAFGNASKGINEVVVENGELSVNGDTLGSVQSEGDFIEFVSRSQAITISGIEKVFGIQPVSIVFEGGNAVTATIVKMITEKL